jgi:hypothetical protein
MVSQYDDTHAELFYCAVQIRLESVNFSLICRNAKHILALGAAESLDRFELSGRGRGEETCLGGRLDLVKRAAWSRQADEWVRCHRKRTGAAAPRCPPFPSAILGWP